MFSMNEPHYKKNVLKFKINQKPGDWEIDLMEAEIKQTQTKLKQCMGCNREKEIKFNGICNFQLL